MIDPERESVFAVFKRAEYIVSGDNELDAIRGIYVVLDRELPDDMVARKRVISYIQRRMEEE